jgi:hypothetical protein
MSRRAILCWCAIASSQRDEGTEQSVRGAAPALPLHGLSSGDFVPALGQFLRSAAGLPTAVVTRLTESWKAEQHALAERDLSRLEEHKLCLRVVIGMCRPALRLPRVQREDNEGRLWSFMSPPDRSAMRSAEQTAPRRWRPKTRRVLPPCGRRVDARLLGKPSGLLAAGPLRSGARRLVARRELQVAGALGRADRRLATAWWSILAFRGMLPAGFAVAMGAVVAAVQHRSSLALPLGGGGRLRPAPSAELASYSGQREPG